MSSVSPNGCIWGREDQTDRIHFQLSPSYGFCTIIVRSNARAPINYTEPADSYHTRG